MASEKIYSGNYNISHIMNNNGFGIDRFTL